MTGERTAWRDEAAHGLTANCAASLLGHQPQHRHRASVLHGAMPTCPVNEHGRLWP